MVISSGEKKMSETICPNCGKKRRWYEVKKMDPITKEQICRKCNSPLNSNIEKSDTVQESVDSSNSTESDLTKLVNDIHFSFNQIRKKQKNISNPSIPILYFGDITQYNKSQIKIITVGTNPNHDEFPFDSPFTRFKKAEQLDSILNENDVSNYLTSLNNYFNDDPNKWFDSFLPIFEGMSTSFFPEGSRNIALHTNFCSPFATDISWGKLRSSIQFTLGREGRTFWHRLVKILEPDMILFSISERFRNRVLFNKSGWKVFKSITTKADGSPRVKPYNVEITECRIGLKQMYLVYGPPSYLPFGSLSVNHKVQLGEDLNRLIN